MSEPQKSKRGGKRPGAGRPKSQPAAGFLEHAAAHAGEALETITQLMAGADSESVRLDAAKEILALALRKAGMAQKTGKPCPNHPQTHREIPK
jgi:hypothetical protein